MKKIPLLLTKLSLLLGLLLLIGGSTRSNAPHNHRTIADDDTIYLLGAYRVPGHIFNAIDPHYLTNRGGFSTRVFDARVSGAKVNSFSLNTFNDPFQHLNPFCETCNTCEMCSRVDKFSTIALGAVLQWNYFINDHFLEINETRALVSTLMPQAIERVAFIPVPADSANVVHSHWLRRSQDKETGRVRIYTRPIPYTISDENTLYLLNGVVITPRIFEAIRPIYIKSLARITDRDELSNFSQSGLQEVVKVETFAALGDFFVTIVGTPSVLLVDGIELPRDTQLKLKTSFFKMQQDIGPEDEDFETLEQQFPGIRGFTIITLH